LIKTCRAAEAKGGSNSIQLFHWTNAVRI